MALSRVSAVRQLDSHTYSADFSPDWVIGSVPHGGYVTSCFQQVIRAHFATTLRRQNQSHAMTLHLDFLRRTQIGPATFKVRDIKLGRQASVVHVALYQDDREEVVGYFNVTNLAGERGQSFSTIWRLNPRPKAVADFAALLRDEDAHWGERVEWPREGFRKATQHIRSWFPRAGQQSPDCLDMWYRFKDDGSRFTNDSLGFICDTFPQMIEAHMLDGVDTYSVDFERNRSAEEQRKVIGSLPSLWYPTVLLNIDVKKALPEDGVEFLFLRVQAKVIKNGRYDLEVLVMDAEGDLVAVSNHVVLIVSAERNVAARRKTNDGGSKL